MQRRNLLKWLSAGILGSGIPWKSNVMAAQDTSRGAQEDRQEAFEHFPFRLFETTGRNALAKWRELKSSGEGSPVILGGGEDLHSIMDQVTPFAADAMDAPSPQSVEEILAAASAIRFPDDLARHKKAEQKAALEQLKAALAANPDMPVPQINKIENGKTRTYSRDEAIALMESDSHEPVLGEWPVSPIPSLGLSIARDLVSRKLLPRVYIALVPTDDWTTIPAYLRWGGWNDCPAPEYHVAAMRHWRDHYGAELVGINADTINVWAPRRPGTREEALGLAREQYIYCEDIIDQGIGTYRALAADLMANDWWYFWWD